MNTRIPLRYIWSARLGLAALASLWATVCLALEPHALCNREFSKADLQNLAGEYKMGFGTSHITSGDRTVSLDFYLPVRPDFGIPISSKQVSSGSIVYRDEGREGRYANGDLYLAQPGGDGESYRFLRGLFGADEIILNLNMFMAMPSSQITGAQSFRISEVVANALADSVFGEASEDMDEAAFRETFGHQGISRFKQLMGCEGWDFPWFLIPGASTSAEGKPLVFLYRLVLVDFDEEGAHFLGTLEWWSVFHDADDGQHRDIYQIRGVVLSKSE